MGKLNKVKKTALTAFTIANLTANAAFFSNGIPLPSFSQPKIEIRIGSNFFENGMSNLQKREEKEYERRIKKSREFKADPTEVRNTYSKFKISSDFRCFLEEYMEEGKDVDNFLNEIDERCKQYAVDILNQNRKEKSAANPQELKKIGKKTKTIAKEFRRDIIDIVTDNTRQSFKEYSKFIALYTFFTSLAGVFIGSRSGPYQAFVGGATGALIGFSGSALYGIGVNKKGLSIGEEKVFRKIASMTSSMNITTPMARSKTGILNLPLHDIEILINTANNGVVPK